jgi:hypothetical protein
MEQLDVEHDKGLYQTLLKTYQDKIGFTPGGTGGTTGTGTTGSGTTGSGTGPQPPPPPPPPPPGLSTPEQRAAELLSLLPVEVKQPWMAAALVELVKSVRRVEDRIVQRVLAGLGK